MTDGWTDRQNYDSQDYAIIAVSCGKNWSHGLSVTLSDIACSHCRHGPDKTVLSCPCRQCEQAITVTDICQVVSGRKIASQVKRAGGVRVGKGNGYNRVRACLHIRCQAQIARIAEHRLEQTIRMCVLCIRTWSQQNYMSNTVVIGLTEIKLTQNWNKTNAKQCFFQWNCFFSFFSILFQMLVCYHCLSWVTLCYVSCNHV